LNGSPYRRQKFLRGSWKLGYILIDIGVRIHIYN
jgi:hypothetical protein